MKLKYNDFIKSVGILITGTVLAQLLSFIAIPFIARIYGPEENAYLGLFLKFATLGATVFTARLELVLPIERQKHYAFGIYQFSLRLSLILSLICFIALIIYSILTSQEFSEFIFILSIPLGVFIISFFNLGNSWELRNENYKEISRASIILSFVSNSIKILGGLVMGHYLVLIFATILAYILASFKFAKKYLFEFKAKQLSYNSKRTKLLVKEQSDFYTYNLFHVLVDLTKDILLASFLWIYFSKIDYGSYEFSFRMMRIPIALIGVAMSQVYFRKAQNHLQDSKKLKSMTIKTLLISSVSAVPFAVIFFYGEEIFTYVFSEKWTEAGKIAEIIAPWLFLNFLLTPISYLPIIFKKQKMYFWINAGFLLMILIFGLFVIYFKLVKEEFLFGLLSLHVVYFIGLLAWFYFLIERFEKKINDK